MRPASVLVDVAIDPGGGVETARPTTHAEPGHEVDGIVRYCVANMPGAVPVTSTRAPTSATPPYVRAGEIVSAPVAQAYAEEHVAT